MPETVTVNSAGAEMKLYQAKPDGAAKGAVIVIQEAFGMTDHIKDVCARLAVAGYLAVAPHVFHRSGDPLISYADMKDVVAGISSNRSAVAHLGDRPRNLMPQDHRQAGQHPGECHVEEADIAVTKTRSLHIDHDLARFRLRIIALDHLQRFVEPGQRWGPSLKLM